MRTRGDLVAELRRLLGDRSPRALEKALTEQRLQDLAALQSSAGRGRGSAVPASAGATASKSTIHAVLDPAEHRLPSDEVLVALVRLAGVCTPQAQQAWRAALTRARADQPGRPAVPSSAGSTAAAPSTPVPVVVGSPPRTAGALQPRPELRRRITDAWTATAGPGSTAAGSVVVTQAAAVEPGAASPRRVRARGGRPLPGFVRHCVSSRPSVKNAQRHASYATEHRAADGNDRWTLRTRLNGRVR